MRKKRLIGILMAMFFMLTGCVPVPDNVKQDILARRQQSETEAQQNRSEDLQMIPVGEAAKNTPATYRDKTGNVTFDGIVQMPDVKALYKYKIGVSDWLYKNSDRVRKQFLKYYDNLEKKSEQKPEPDEVGYYDSIEYADANDPVEGGHGDFLRMGINGELTLGMYTDIESTPDAVERWFPFPGPEEKSEHNYFYGLDGRRLNGQNDEVKLDKGKSETIEQAKENLQMFLDDYEALTGMEVAIDRITTSYNDKTDANNLSANATFVYDGVRVDDGLQLSQPIREYNNICRLYTRVHQLEVGSGTYPLVTTFNYCYVPEEKVETYERILSFESAWELLQKKTADQIKVQIERADLMYSLWYIPKGDTDMDWDLQMSEPPEIYATPVWRFVSYHTEEDPYTYYVDAVTGEIWAYEQSIYE